MNQIKNSFLDKRVERLLSTQKLNEKTHIYLVGLTLQKNI